MATTSPTVPTATVSIMKHFAVLEYPRVEHTKTHNLLNIIAIAVCAVICGAEGDQCGRVWTSQTRLVGAIPRLAQWHPCA